MGEYARRLSDGEEIKIGTCEDMYYLRADQRRLVAAIPHSLNPNTQAVGLRFRFPWPDEDRILPGGGEFHDNGYRRAITVDGVDAGDVEHHNVQFTAPGYVTSLPCPEGPAATHGLNVHRNGFAGAVQLVAQKLLDDGRLVPVMRCGGCGSMWRIEEPAEIEALAVAFRVMGDKRKNNAEVIATGEKVGDRFWHAIADRILAGAGLTQGVTV